MKLRVCRPGCLLLIWVRFGIHRGLLLLGLGHAIVDMTESVTALDTTDITADSPAQALPTDSEAATDESYPHIDNTVCNTDHVFVR